MIETLMTRRLRLRPFAREDLAAWTDLAAESSMWWFPLRRGMSEDEAAAFLERTLEASGREDEPALHAVVERASGLLVGYAGLAVPRFLPQILPAVEVGWRLGERFRGRGYATEAARAAVDWGFDRLGLDEIVSVYERDNVASGRVMDRLGFDEGFETVQAERQLTVVVRRLGAASWSRRAPGAGERS